MSQIYFSKRIISTSSVLICITSAISRHCSNLINSCPSLRNFSTKEVCRTLNCKLPVYYNMEQVVLVNEQDQELGTMEKMEAHRLGVLHRAFSVFIFNERGQMLLQQRALHKY